MSSALVVSSKTKQQKITLWSVTHVAELKMRSMWFFFMDQIFDGHNGSAAAIYSKENLLNDILSAIPPRLKRDEWLAALPRAMVAGFMKTDKEFQARGKFGAL